MTSSSRPSLVNIILSEDETIRNQSLSNFCRDKSTKQLLKECEELDAFRRQCSNLYERVRACFFLYAIHRFHLQRERPPPGTNKDDDSGGVVGDDDTLQDSGEIPHNGYQLLQERQFEQSIEIFLSVHKQHPSRSISSALAKAYYHLGFQTLADQVRLSVKQHPGNSWMFQKENDGVFSERLSIRSELLTDENTVLREQTPVRMDLSHCGWSDIFFLGMDFPQGARVLNISIDLSIHGRGDGPVPPIQCYLQVIPDASVLKLTSIDLNAEVTLTKIAQVFDFCGDYLGLLRAGVIASGIVPLSYEKSDDEDAPLSQIFDTLVGRNKGLHLVTHVVNDIPKGSRLAVSTNMLGSIIALCMRATGQTSALTGPLLEEERRLVAARAILGEWLGGSGGGWQDSGGLWPGIKLIQGVITQPSDPEHGTSRGRLLPIHRQLSDLEAPPSLIQALQDHLVLVHGGMAQNVGPVLEMVTEKYLLREAQEWKARQDALTIFDDILKTFKNSDVSKLAKLTTRNFFEPLQTIIPWATNLYTETLIERARERFGEDFLGFWMLGGCSGGGMGFIFKPHIKDIAKIEMHQIMLQTKNEMQHALPFAMDPVVYDFSINHYGTVADWCSPDKKPIQKNKLPAKEAHEKASSQGNSNDEETSLDLVLQKLGFDQTSHEVRREAYRTAKIGLKQNRLPVETELLNVLPADVVVIDELIRSSPVNDLEERGLDELRKGTVGVVTLAAGIGSRWTQGAGCVKAIHPFCKLGGKHRTFLEIHLAKSRRISELAGGTNLPHIITTSYMTDSAIRTYLDRVQNHGYEGPLHISRGSSVGLRLVPTVADLDFHYEQQAMLDEQAQKVRESSHRATKAWAKSCGEASDYRDNLAMQCLHPVGHFYEVPNLLLNGTLRQLLEDRPQLQFLMLHNVDTVGADVDPVILGLVKMSQAMLNFEVVPRQIQDVGGGLAKVHGKTRLVEGLALPREEDEFQLTYYNTMTTWIRIDKFLDLLGLTREDLHNNEKVSEAVRDFSHRLPTYVALKEVKKRWGNGQEDVYPTAQFEKLWSDMTSLDGVHCDYFVVSRNRGSQLKDVSQLDGWLRDGSSLFLETICNWESGS